MTRHAAHGASYELDPSLRAVESGRQSVASGSGRPTVFRLHSTERSTGQRASATRCGANTTTGDGIEMLSADGRRMRKLRRARKRYRWAGGQLAPDKRTVLRRAVSA